MTRRIMLAVVAALAASLGLPSATAAQPVPLDGFDALVASAVRDWQVPGLAVAVVKDGTVIFSKGYGVRELGTPATVDEHTLFAIGSTTKAMTAALVGMLVDEKKLAWDDPVIKHLPWFATADPYVTRELTVRDLLTHRGGLGNADYLWYGQDTPPREILQRVRLLRPGYSLRSSFIYQNVMYAAAGAVVEAVSGRPWEEMMRTRIFEPLGMTETIATAATLARQPNVALPHFTIEKTVKVIENASVGGVGPAGSVWSSVHDMAKWSAMLLTPSTSLGSGGPPLLTAGTLEELFKPQTIVTNEAFYPTARLTKPKWKTYGLGWFQQDYRGRAVDYHTGSIDGMVAIHGLLRDQNVGVLVLANRDHAELRHALMFDVFDRFIGGPRRDWSADLRALYDGLEKEGDAERHKAEAKRVAGTKPSLPLAAYAGTYTDPLYGDLVITIAGGRLKAQYGTAFAGPLEHWHFDTFQAKWDAAWRGKSLVAFGLDEDGTPATLEAMGMTFTRAK
jgi:CubicO group peptidase (beta-lactamase class C family)